jgi:hypothetical protein
VQTFGGDGDATAGTAINFTQSGGLVRNGVMEFDLSSTADGRRSTACRLQSR